MLVSKDVAHYTQMNIIPEYYIFMSIDRDCQHTELLHEAF